jgi:hypothetical protein
MPTEPRASAPWRCRLGLHDWTLMYGLHSELGVLKRKWCKRCPTRRNA